MSWTQTLAPNPSTACRPGWCLEYVRKAFGLAARFPTAMAAWLNSTSKHQDWQFPAGVWVPVWFAVRGVPAGHVALLAPDGAVYSTTHPTNLTPTRHPNLTDLMNVYARAGLPLTLLGWTEDVAGSRVISWVNPPPVPTPTPARKSNDQLASEVLAGQYGNDPERSNRLRAEGYDPAAVQAAVNARYAAPAGPSIDDLARAVIRGEYGNGADRAARLGGNAAAVQARVNQILIG